MSARLGGWKKCGRWAKRMSCGESSRDHRCIEDGRSAKLADPLPQRLICKLFLRSLLSEQLPDKETKMIVAVGLLLRYCLFRYCSMPFRWSSETELPGRFNTSRKVRGFVPGWMSTGSADTVPFGGLTNVACKRYCVRSNNPGTAK